MTQDKVKSYVFDILQVGIFFYFLFTSPAIILGLPLVLLQFCAFIILLVAVWNMRRTRFYRVPDVGKQKELVTNGIYRYTRNPMYLAQLLFTGSLLLDVFSYIRLLVYIAYIVNFLLKIQYEETLLSRNFKEFENYKKTSFRLVPYVY